MINLSVVDEGIVGGIEAGVGVATEVGNLQMIQSGISGR